MLRNGSRGDAVEDVQAFLTEASIYQGRFDGIYGPKTEAAVRSFQRETGLAADGVWGQKSSLKAIELLRKYQGPGTPIMPTIIQGDPL